MCQMSVEASVERKLPVGAEIQEGGAHFRVWAPRCNTVNLVLLGADGQSERQVLPLEAEGDGYLSAFSAEARVGDFYGYSLDEHRQLYPDPASRFQPRGV